MFFPGFRSSRLPGKLTNKLSGQIKQVFPLWVPALDGCDCHFQWKRYHIHMNRLQKSTLNEDVRVDQKTLLQGGMAGPIFTPQMGMIVNLLSLNNRSYPKLNQEFVFIHFIGSQIRNYTQTKETILSIKLCFILF